MDMTTPTTEPNIQPAARTYAPLDHWLFKLGDDKQPIPPHPPALGLNEAQALKVYDQMRRAVQYSLQCFYQSSTSIMAAPDDFVAHVLKAFLGDDTNPLTQLCAGEGPRIIEDMKVGNKIFKKGALVSDVLKQARTEMAWHQAGA